jgi:uncharacterized protein
MSDEPKDDLPQSNADRLLVRGGASSLKPVTQDARIEAVDMLRGCALLGILVINVISYALPTATLFNPPISGGFAGADLAVWEVSYMVFFQKMMAIFSMLFGAGVILMSTRAEAAGRTFRAIYYRRILWLAIFGLVHAYFFWYGDILFPYAIAGLLLYPLRRISTKFLVGLGSLVLVVGVLMSAGTGMMFEYVRGQAEAGDAAVSAGETMNQQQEIMSEVWDELSQSFNPSPEKISEEIDAMQGSYSEMVEYRLPEAFTMHVQALPFFIFWRVFGMMLIGMGLMKAGVFSAERSMRFYTTLAIAGYVVGFSLTGYGMKQLFAADFDFVYFFRAGGLYDYIGSIFVSLGHVGLLMIIFRSGILSGLRKRLAAVGRMALSNYLTHTVIFSILFCGFGFGLFGEINRFGLIWFVFGTWILQLLISPIWLKHFRFGPAEWIWRTLTYWRKQPMRVASSD